MEKGARRIVRLNQTVSLLFHRVMNVIKFARNFINIPITRILSGTIAAGTLLLIAGCGSGNDSTSSNSTQAPQELGPDHIELVYTFEVGKRYVYQFDMAYETDFGEALGALMPDSQNVTQSQEYSISVVEELPNKGKRLEFAFHKNKFTMNMGDMKMDYDSEKPLDPKDPSSMMFAPFNEAIGPAVTIEIDAENSVTSISGIDEIRDKVVAQAPPQIASMATGIFSTYYVENLTTPSGNPLTPVKPGDSWPSNLTQDLGPLGTFFADMQYQFKKMENHEGSECAQIAYSGTIRGSSASESNDPGQMMEVTGGQLFGKQWFDPAIGHYTDASSEQNMTMKMMVPGLPAEAMAGGGIQLKVKQKISRKMIRIEDIDAAEAEPATSDTAEPTP